MPEASFIVLVTDVPDHARNYERALIAHGYSVVVAGSAAGALDAMRARVPRCAIIDDRVPDSSGWELCRETKLDPRLRAVAVIVLTQDLSAAHAEESVRVGCNAWLARPLAAEDLVRAIRHVTSCDTSEPPSAGAALIGELACPSCASMRLRAAVRIGASQYYRCERCGHYWRTEAGAMTGLPAG